VELEKKGLIIRYSCNGNTYLVAPHFEKHQVGLQKSKEAQSQIPAPTPELLQSYSSISPPKAKAKAKDKDILAQKSDTVDKFDPFWIAYPKKKSKGDAEKTFKKINPDDQLLQIILKAIEVAKKSNDWQKDEGQYIPYPATWLNAKGWEDEILPGGNFGKHQGNTRAPKKPGEYSRPED